MFYQVKAFFIFLWQATNKHGVHSPFVYDLVTKCFNVKTDSKAVKSLAYYRSILSKNKDTIFVTDFGAGSRVFKSNNRKISAIAKNAGISNKKAKLLIKVVNYFKPNTILEIGTSLGIGTYSLFLGNRIANITTLEGCPETSKVAKNQLLDFGVNTINFVQGDFSNTLIEVLNDQYDFIYFDGNHQKEATIEYFEKCLLYINNKTIFVFDDIYWSKGMTDAWNYIKNHPKVTVTIDVFYFGIVSFRKEQEKQHFVIRT